MVYIPVIYDGGNSFTINLPQEVKDYLMSLIFFTVTISINPCNV